MSLNAINLVEAVQVPITTPAAQYTCPPNSKVIVRHVVFCNTAVGAAKLTAEVVPSGGSSGNAAIVIDALSIAAGASYVSPELSGVVLNAGDSIQCFSDTATAISMNASGIQQT
jgi:hypothetical protein